MMVSGLCTDVEDVTAPMKRWELPPEDPNPSPPRLTIRRVKDVLPQIESIRKRGMVPGLSTGWKTLDPLYTVARAQLTIVTGIPNMGKSEFLDALIVKLAVNHDMRFAVFSPENWPLELHVQKLSEKFLGKPFSSSSDFDLAEAVKFLHEHFYFVGTGEDTRLSNITEDALQLFLADEKCRGLVLDPWNEIEHKRPAALSETEYTSHILTELRRFARFWDAHVWIVAHPTKLQRDKTTGKYNPPTLYDVSGSAHWYNKADVGITVHRENPDTFQTDIHVTKMRFKHVGKRGVVTLGYEYSTGRYYDLLTKGNR